MSHESYGREWDALPKSNAGRVAHWFEWVWHRQNADVIDLLFPDDGLAHGLGDEPMRGPAEFRAFHTAFLALFSPVRFEFDHVLETADDRGEYVVLHGGISIVDRGRELTISGMALARMVDGRIAEAWNQFDFQPVLVNRGLVTNEAIMGVFSLPDPDPDPELDA